MSPVDYITPTVTRYSALPLERVHLISRFEDFPLSHDDVVVSAHACGSLTDAVLDRAASVGARVAVLPCCHELRPGRVIDLEGWADGSLAMDVERAVRLRASGYDIHTRCIPARITPKNRLLLGAPSTRGASAGR